MKDFPFPVIKRMLILVTHVVLAGMLALRLVLFSTITSFPFKLVHSDVSTSRIASNSGFIYYLLILDDYSHFV